MGRVVGCLLLIIVALASHVSYAAYVAGIRGRRIFLKLDGSNYQVSQMLEVVNADGDQVAVLRVAKIRGNTALAILVKGRVQLKDVVEKLADIPVAPALQRPQAPPARPVEKVTDVNRGWRAIGGLLALSEQPDLTPVMTQMRYVHLFDNGFVMSGGVSYWFGSSASLELSAIGGRLGLTYQVGSPNNFSFEVGAFLGYDSIQKRSIVERQFIEEGLSATVAGSEMTVIYRVSDSVGLGVNLGHFSYLGEEVELSGARLALTGQYYF